MKKIVLYLYMFKKIAILQAFIINILLIFTSLFISWENKQWIYNA